MIPTCPESGKPVWGWTELVKELAKKPAGAQQVSRAGNLFWGGCPSEGTAANAEILTSAEAGTF